jgi:serine/threonine-protein kinase PknG
MDFKYMTAYEHSLPAPTEQPVLAKNEALYLWLLRAAHSDPEQRFQSAEEMGDQLYGVLREIVALKTGPKPAESSVFTYDNLIDPEDVRGTLAPQARLLPALKMDPTDPAANDLLSLAGIADPKQRASMLLALVNQHGSGSVEARLRYADFLLAQEEHQRANEALDGLAAEDPFNWKVPWYRGKGLLAAGDAHAARAAFERVYFEMPGEVVPKLAIGFAAEQAGEFDVATVFYERVAKTDPNYTTAVFGLARCLEAKNDFSGAASALDMVPPSHSLYLQSRIALVHVLTHDETNIDDPDLEKAARTIEAIPADSADLHQLSAKLLSAAAGMTSTGKLQEDRARTLLGTPMDQDDLRRGAEAAYRKAARFAASAREREALVDRANETRPVTLF